MIINKTQNVLLAENEKYCTSVFTQSRGLMFSKRKNLVFVFNKPKKVDLHNFFVFFPHDVLVVDKQKKITQIKRGFKPFSLFHPKKASYIIELADPINRTYEVGDQLEF